MGCGASHKASAWGTPEQGLAGVELLRSTKAYVESEAFTVPLYAWVDEHCVTFSDEGMVHPSMVQAYSDAHSEYIHLTDNLLNVHLAGKTSSRHPLTRFYRACRDHPTSDEVCSPAIRQVLAMSDREGFIMMMVCAPIAGTHATHCSHAGAAL
eukprot:SAG25_NODE_1053_length_4170_cov_1.592238_2_plen_153_part_00